MSAPKLERILNAVAARLSAIDGSGNYVTRIGCNIRRSRVEPGKDDLPCALLFLDARTSNERSADGAQARVSCTLVVEGYVPRPADGNDENAGIAVLSDIQRAMELTAGDRIGGLLIYNDKYTGLSWERDEVLYPNIGGAAVGGRVEYQIPHLRIQGDPEQA